MTERMTAAELHAAQSWGRRKGQPERVIHEAVLGFLSTAFPDAVIHHSPNEVDIRGEEAARTIVKARRMGTVKGWPDIEMICRGAFWTFEVKAPGNQASDDQKACGARIIAAGGRWAVVRSIDDVAECVEEWRGDHGLQVRGAIK